MPYPVPFCLSCALSPATVRRTATCRVCSCVLPQQTLCQAIHICRGCTIVASGTGLATLPWLEWVGTGHRRLFQSERRFLILRAGGHVRIRDILSAVAGRRSPPSWLCLSHRLAPAPGGQAVASTVLPIRRGRTDLAQS